MNGLKHKQKMPKRGTVTKLAACEHITIDENGVVKGYKDEKTQIEALRTNKNLKGYIVKTYTIETTTEIKVKED